MQLGLLNEEDWYKLNESLRQQLQYGSDVQLRTYKGLAHAFYETVVGHAQFLSHKRSVVLIKGDSFLSQQIFPWFYREGYNVQTFKRSDIQNQSVWVDSLKKDTVCVAYFEDHPVTGEIFDWKKIDDILNERKIFGVRLSHRSTTEPQSVQAYSVRIQPLNPTYAVAALGVKYRSPQVISAHLPWTGIKVETENAVQDKTTVQSFEKSLPAGFAPLLVTESRAWDRSVIYHEAVSGEFLLQKVAEDLNIKLALPGLETRIETLNLCRWKNPRLLQEWWDQVPKEELLQRTLILSTEILQKHSIQILRRLQEIPSLGKIQF